MKISVTTKWNGDDFIKRLTAAVDVAHEAAAQVLVRAITDQLGRQNGGVRSKPGQPPTSQSGKLSQGIGYSKPVGGKNIVGSGAKYAKVLEFGMLIRAKRKFMLYPITKDAEKFVRDSGASEGKTGEGLKRYEETYADTIVRMRQGGKILIGRVQGGSKYGQVLIEWIMAPRVYIAPRPFIRPALAKAKTEMGKAFQGTLNRQMGG